MAKNHCHILPLSIYTPEKANQLNVRYKGPEGFPLAGIIGWSVEVIQKLNYSRRQWLGFSAGPGPERELLCWQKGQKKDVWG